MARSNSRGRAWLPMRSASAKPRLTTSSVRSPLRSSSALVATVVPILTASIGPGGIGASSGMPEHGLDAGDGGVAVAAGVLRQQLVGGSAVPSGSRATMSVNVPPRSIQNCHCPWVMRRGLAGVRRGCKRLRSRWGDRKNQGSGETRGLTNRRWRNASPLFQHGDRTESTVITEPEAPRMPGNLLLRDPRALRSFFRIEKAGLPTPMPIGMRI